MKRIKPSLAWLLCACSWLAGLCTAGSFLGTPAKSGDLLIPGPSPAATLEPRAFLPLVAKDFCVPPSIPEGASLSGVVFFDYNGDGQRQREEPGIARAIVAVDDYLSTSRCDGTYYFADLPDGTHRLAVSAATFRFIALSASEFQSSDTSIQVQVHGCTSRDIGLMQGFLTLPFGRDTIFTRPSPFGYTSVFDLDPRVGFARAYDPAIRPSWEAVAPPWVMDNHVGLDFCIAEGTKIRAAMPGVVTYVGEDQYGGRGIWICYGPWANYYNHNSVILVHKDQAVARGQVIALSGNTGQSGEPHLHFSLTTCTTPPEWLDPYRDLTDPSSKSQWTKDNDLQYPLTDSSG